MGDWGGREDSGVSGRGGWDWARQQNLVHQRSLAVPLGPCGATGQWWGYLEPWTAGAQLSPQAPGVPGPPNTAQHHFLGVAAWPPVVQLQAWAWAEQGGEESPSCLLGMGGSLPILFGAISDVAAGGRLFPYVWWNWRMKLDGRGQAGRGHSMAKMMTGWLPWPHHISLLPHTHCDWDGVGSQLATQCIQQARSCASPLCLCLHLPLEGQPGGCGTWTHLLSLLSYACPTQQPGRRAVALRLTCSTQTAGSQDVPANGRLRGWWVAGCSCCWALLTLAHLLPLVWTPRGRIQPGLGGLEPGQRGPIPRCLQGSPAGWIWAQDLACRP